MRFHFQNIISISIKSYTPIQTLLFNKISPQSQSHLSLTPTTTHNCTFPYQPNTPRPSIILRIFKWKERSSVKSKPYIFYSSLSPFSTPLSCPFHIFYATILFLWIGLSFRSTVGNFPFANPQSTFTLIYLLQMELIIFIKLKIIALYSIGSYFPAQFLCPLFSNLHLLCFLNELEIDSIYTEHILCLHLLLYSIL